ncbi:MAG: hypothetical protein ABI607_05210 [Betaproteobacteria bacterium]
MSLIRFASALSLAAVAGCATVSPPTSQAPAFPVPPPASSTVPLPAPKPYVEPPPPPINLQGFPQTYRLGFGDGCATARGTDQKDAARFAADGNYRTGWQDGVAQCKKR